MICDATLATGLPGVYAAGDVAQGAAAARHALDPAAARPLVPVPYFWSDWYGHRIQFVGTPRAEEVVVAVPAEAGFTALYRRGDRIVGAFTVDRPREIMKYRRRVAARGSWAEAVAFAATTTTAA
ncbi:oxidoreductase C-terminal domain-containing protein [Prauserella oleivorans]|uniref:Reductase C-terminal domain-containing protein n=2 Tax=Pseudonocardiaceae TaxID=2070 RepID=A0ABP7JS62_9PSEU